MKFQKIASVIGLLSTMAFGTAVYAQQAPDSTSNQQKTEQNSEWKAIVGIDMLVTRETDAPLHIPEHRFDVTLKKGTDELTKHTINLKKYTYPTAVNDRSDVTKIEYIRGLPNLSVGGAAYILSDLNLLNKKAANTAPETWFDFFASRNIVNTDETKVPVLVDGGFSINQEGRNVVYGLVDIGLRTPQSAANVRLARLGQLNGEVGNLYSLSSSYGPFQIGVGSDGSGQTETLALTRTHLGNNQIGALLFHTDNIEENVKDFDKVKLQAAYANETHKKRQISNFFSYKSATAALNLFSVPPFQGPYFSPSIRRGPTATLRNPAFTFEYDRTRRESNTFTEIIVGSGISIFGTNIYAGSGPSWTSNGTSTQKGIPLEISLTRKIKGLELAVDFRVEDLNDFEKSQAYVQAKYNFK